MGRAVLAAGALLWGVAAAAAAAVAVAGVDRLLALLPPLAVDADAVRGAAVAVSVALWLAAVVHAAVLVALQRGIRIAWSAGALLSGLGVALTIGLAATAFASAAAEPPLTVPLVAAGLLSLAVSFAYAAATAWFVGEIRAGTPSGGGP